MKTLLLLLFTPITILAQQTLTDTRDGQTYAITTLGDLQWMKENLRYDAPGSKCLQHCDVIRFYDFQYLDQVCPEGWRLPQMHEWDLFVYSFEEAEIGRMFEGNKKNYRADFLDRYDLFASNKLNIKPYGRMEGGKVRLGTFIDYWTTNDATDQRFHMHISPYAITGHAHKHHLKPGKPDEYRLFPIRCVCEVKE